MITLLRHRSCCRGIVTKSQQPHVLMINGGLSQQMEGMIQCLLCGTLYMEHLLERI